MTRIEKHPYNDQAIPDGTRLLIVGTAPPPRFSCPAPKSLVGFDFDFFYGSQDNYMWEFLDQIAEHIEGHNLFEEDTSRDQCCDITRDFLRRHKIWMHDVLQTYQRKDGRDDKAGDNDIKPPFDLKSTNFRTVLESKSFSKFVFTSERAAEWTISALEQEGLLTRPEFYKHSLSQWQGIDKALPIQQYIQKKFKQPLEVVPVV